MDKMFKNIGQNVFQYIIIGILGFVAITSFRTYETVRLLEFKQKFIDLRSRSNEAVLDVTSEFMIKAEYVHERIENKVDFHLKNHE